MAAELSLPPELQGCPVFPATAEQRAAGWSQNWPKHWEAHDALLKAGGHPPTLEQQARGWTQNYDAWKAETPDEEIEGGGRIVHYDFTGGAVVRAAKAQASKETDAWQLAQLKVMRDVAAGRVPAVKAVPFKPPQLLTAPLNTGALMPLLGLGTWKSKPGQVRDAVLYAVTQAGYRHIDCAAIYENEGEVGSALTEAFAKWDIKREEIFITSKLWNTDHTAARVEPAVRKCLKLLNLDYLDAFLIHWPITGNRGDTLSPPTRETWAALEAVQAKGLVRHLGVSNFSVAKMQDIMSYAKVPISIAQCESHPYFRNDALVNWCTANGVHFTAFSPLGSPDSADIFKRTTAALMDDPVVHDLSSRYGKNIGQVLIKWALQHRPQSSVLPKSVSPERILGNAAVDWELSSEDVARLSALGPQCRMVHGGVFLSPAGPYRTLKDLWDTDE